MKNVSAYILSQVKDIRSGSGEFTNRHVGDPAWLKARTFVLLDITDDVFKIDVMSIDSYT